MGASGDSERGHDQAAPESNSWWDVPVAQVSELDSVNRAREEYTRGRALQRRYLSGES